MADLGAMSMRLYDVLEMVGASESMRKTHHSIATTQDILGKVLLKRLNVETCFIHQCGSSYEGTVTPDLASDTDMIICHIEPLVVPHRLTAGPGLFLHMVREVWTRPGYVKLQAMFHGIPFTNHEIDEQLLGVDFDGEGRVCFVRIGIGSNIHGPAEMFVSENGVHYADHVMAWKCQGIPLFATEWITRRRYHGWPSQQAIDELKRLGCMFVRVGHFRSPEEHLEWRLSFSLQERQLMRSLSPVQHKVYVLLKMIKKNVLETCLNEESLTSYHFKTCVFYMAETTPASMWVPENLISCLLRCLERILGWIRDRFCPSYFLKDQNLFDKDGFLTLFDPLEKMIDLLLRTGHQFLYLIQSDNVGEMLRCGDLSIYRSFSNYKIGEYMFHLRWHLSLHIILTQRQPRLSTHGDHDKMSLYMAQLDEIQHFDSVIGYTEEEISAALQYALPWLHLSIGLEYAARAATCLNRHERDDLLRTADTHMQQAGNPDMVNVSLAQASICMKFDKLEECFLLLQEIDNIWTSRVFTVCPCTMKGHLLVYDEHQQRELYLTWCDMQLTQLMKTYISSCVIFERSQVELVPTPLRYEMFRSLGTHNGSRDALKDRWFDRAVVDAKVYLYLLQYLVSSTLNRETHKEIAVDNLVALVQYDDREALFHRETGYNLLGWVYLQEQRYDDAIRCFRQSWEIRPHHNAAKFHVLNIIISAAGAQSSPQNDT